MIKNCANFLSKNTYKQNHLGLQSNDNIFTKNLQNIYKKYLQKYPKISKNCAN
jgi:hypothetical protein